MTEKEIFFLLSSVWLHDIGIFEGVNKDRFWKDIYKCHRERSVEWIARNFDKEKSTRSIRTADGQNNLSNLWQ